MVNEKPRWGWLQIMTVYLATLGISYLAAQYLVSRAVSSIQFYTLAYLIQFSAVVIMVYLLAVLLPRGRWSDLGLRAPSLGTIWRYGILGGCLMISMVLMLGVVIKYLQPNIPPQQIEEILRSTTQTRDFVILMLAGTILAPINEEIFYRGMIYPVFRRHLGPAWGALAAGALFGMAHMDLWRAIPLGLGGAGLCYIYEKTGTIVASIIAHGVWNGFMFVILYLSIFQGLV